MAQQLAREDVDGEGPLQYSLRTLLVIQAVCAVFCAMAVTCGPFAILALFVGTLVYAMAPVRPEHDRLRRMIVDLLGGVILPCLCFVADPFALRSNASLAAAPPSALVAIVYLLAGFQMLALLVWLLFGRYLRCAGGVVTGVLSIGTTMAIAFGLILLPFSLLGLIFFGLRFLGFVLFLTAVVYGRNAAKALREDHGGRPLARIFLGVLIAIVVPMLAYGLVGDRIGALPEPAWWEDLSLPK